MKYWFVNLGKYYKEQREGNYLWAPIKNSQGKSVSHWDSLNFVNKGDIIFCNNNGKIVSVGVVLYNAYPFDIPNEFGNTWRTKGRRIDLKFIDLEVPFKFSSHKLYILEHINKDENPFDINGNAKQGYLFPFDTFIANYFINKINDNKLKELILKIDCELEEELEEYQEEQEQIEKINDGLIKGYSEAELSQKESKKYRYVPQYKEGNTKLVREKTDGRLKATRIEKANYLCEVNNNHITLSNTSGKHQFMECHHIIPMNAQKHFIDIKLDAMFNLISLCPICHAQMHNASNEDKWDIFQKIYKVREKEMIEKGFDFTKMEELFNKYYKNKIRRNK